MPLHENFKVKSAADVAPEPRQIFQAILDSNVDGVVTAMVAGENLNTPSAFKLTPLHVACRVYGVKAGPGFCRPQAAEMIIKILLSAGVSAIARDALGHMPIEYCEGHAPKFLRDTMQRLADQNTWPAPNPESHGYRKEDVEALRVGGRMRFSRPANFVPTGCKKDRPRKHSAEAA